MSQIFKGEPRMKRFILLAVATIFFAFQIAVGSVVAVELDTDVRTVPLNTEGDTTILSLQQVQEGKRLFNYACAKCHAGGRTKTDPNVGLSTDVLAGATPPRDNIAALVDYMKNPTTYDGETEISELHPSKKSADIYPEMRNLTDDDLKEIAGHILLQPKILGKMWGGGKVFN
jgi:photosystem II cytochrome c550